MNKILIQAYINSIYDISLTNTLKESIVLYAVCEKKNNNPFKEYASFSIRIYKELMKDAIKSKQLIFEPDHLYTIYGHIRVANQRSTIPEYGLFQVIINEENHYIK